MTKITAEHLARCAYVYIRQSTADQLVHNLQSQRRQYGLADRARPRGWTAVEVIDEDLGRSGGGVDRPGFTRLLAAICEGAVGAVLAIEVSRLARNGRDWHKLIEFCGLVGTIIVDEDGIYDPRHPNDRLLLGMKGTMSELELSMFRQRSQEALKQKARRGALFLRVAAGYVKAGRDRIEKDPNRRDQEALNLVFAKFAEFQSARQVGIWLRDEGIELPVKARNPEALPVVWRLPAYNTVHNILTNPIYAGAYAFGRTKSTVSVVGGRKRVRRGVRRPPAEWDVLIKEQRRLHQLGPVREKSTHHRRQCDRLRQCRCQGRRTTRRGAARRASALRALRPQAACPLQQQHRALPLLWSPGEPRHRQLHLDWQRRRRCGGQHRGAAGPEAIRRGRCN